MILLLAGTGEARALAAGLQQAGIPTLASLAGATRQAAQLQVETRVGGFGGAEGFARVLAEQGITAVIDATHPFAAQISQRSQAVCAARGVPYLQVLRPAWEPMPGDDWKFAENEHEVLTLTGSKNVIFLATGRQTLHRFAGLSGREVICRQIDPPEAPFPFEGGRYLVGRPPFSVEDEVRLFHDLGVECLVVKNAGGAASATKLTAARQLQIPVIMINRPPQPPGQKVATVEAALDWVQDQWMNA